MPQRLAPGRLAAGQPRAPSARRKDRVMAPPMPARPPLPRPRLPAGSLPDPGASAVPLLSLLAVVSDELRAPLRSMLAGAEMLLEHGDTLDQGTVGNLLAAIRHSTIGLTELVENLLCMSSIDAGRFALQRRA